MGRRQRNQKLKTVDPYYTGHRSNGKDLHKDLRPSDPENDQPLPKKFKLLFPTAAAGKRKPGKQQSLGIELQNQKGKSTLKPESVSNSAKEDESRKSSKAPAFKKGEGESTKKFLERVDRETNNQLAEHYKALQPKSTKKKLYTAKRKEKALWKKKGGSLEGLQEMKDRVRFGDVVKEPPQLTHKPRKATQHTTADRTMSLQLAQGPERKEELEKERQRVVQVYRMKKKILRTTNRPDAPFHTTHSLT